MLKRLTVKVAVLWGSGMAWVLQSTSSVLLCSVQEGTAVSSGEVPHCFHRQLSAHLMHPLAGSTQRVNPCCRSLAPSLLFCFMYSYQCVSSVSSWLSKLSAMTYGGVSVLRQYYCHKSLWPECQEGVLFNGAKMLSGWRSCSCMHLCSLLPVMLGIFFFCCCFGAKPHGWL